jgi:hypothetical protein
VSDLHPACTLQQPSSWFGAACEKTTRPALHVWATVQIRYLESDETGQPARSLQDWYDLDFWSLGQLHDADVHMCRTGTIYSDKIVTLTVRSDKIESQKRTRYCNHAGSNQRFKQQITMMTRMQSNGRYPLIA